MKTHEIKVEKNDAPIPLHYTRTAKGKRALKVELAYQLLLIDALDRRDWIIYLDGQEWKRGAGYAETP